MNARTRMYGWIVALAVAAAGGDAAGAPGGTGRQAWSTFVEAVAEGRLDAARLELGGLRAAMAPTPALERAERIIAQRAADAQRLMTVAERDLGQADLGAALRRLAHAAQFDRRVRNAPVMTRASAARADLDAALAVLDGCRRKREITCMTSALSRLRQLDRFNADAMLAELAGEDWYPGSSARRAHIDAPPLGQ